VKRLLLVVCLAALAACATERRPGGIAGSDAGSPSGAVTRDRAAAMAVASATAMVGQPYRWGGAEPGGFDCSGLVVYAMASAGLELPRTVEQQLHAGIAISRRDITPGDLVFMHLTRKQLHVGIALDADRFVHAPSAGHRVRIDSLAAAPYARGFFEARRVVDRSSAR
jgi:cell wall-associated NlpC family hydrolase